jgi:hypothetical protein
MSWRRVTLSVIALIAALIGLIGIATSALAAPSATGAPKEGAKVTLSQTSIDGPAIMATYGLATVLAWTGTDSGHHINLMTSGDGLHYTNKVTLPETSLWRPAIAFIDTGRGAPYGTIVLAWTGTDSRHTLNLEFLKMPGYVVVQKVTLWGEWSFTAPAVTTVNGDINSHIYLAWAGTDPAHTLNVIHRTTNPVTQSKRILWGWSSVSRPNLSTDLSSGAVKPLLMSWTGVNNRIYFAGSSDGATWPQPSASPLTAQSAWAPTMVGFNSTTIPTHWVAWTGNGSASSHSISVRYTQHFPSWSDTGAQATLGEWAISSPALAFGGGATSVLLIAWTGTDSAHHLNVAVLTV